MKFFSYICKCVALDTGMCAIHCNALLFVSLHESKVGKGSVGLLLPIL